MTTSETALAGKSFTGTYFPPTRLAVSGLFLLNGTFAGAWAPKIPEFAARFGLTEAGLGLMIMCFGIGSLILMPIAGVLIAHFGTTRTVKGATILFLTTMLLLSAAPTIPLGAIAVFLFGGLMGGMDVAMNGNAVEVEKSMRRAIMSSCHAFWSLGAFIGAATGGFLMEALGVMGHAALLTVAGAAMLVLVWPRILHDAHHPGEERQKVRLPLTPLPWLIGLMALFCMVPEGAILDWGALYVRNELGASLALSGFAFGTFSLTMAVMRFAGDHVRDRFGAVKTLRFCTVMAILGMVVAGTAPNAYVAIAGFALCGVGISNMVPIAFSAAGNLPGYAQGVALSVATVMGYSGSLFAPSFIGFIAEHVGFAMIFTLLPLLFIVVLALSHHAVHADVRERH
ncbi:MAG: MFS transporter [Shinella zoogloeoides]|uniref:MFS transporter n=1 Tax=Shinella zoogloeoides TaxID=352475 RepID=UPI00299D4985|nr:MFS transporter [Shinella zoogloeoides]WPE21804.1 Inner membrane protein YbjJ [Shinella zoogloeoides]